MVALLALVAVFAIASDPPPSGIAGATRFATTALDSASRSALDGSTARSRMTSRGSRPGSRPLNDILVPKKDADKAAALAKACEQLTYAKP